MKTSIYDSKSVQTVRGLGFSMLGLALASGILLAISVWVLQSYSGVASASIMLAGSVGGLTSWVLYKVGKRPGSIVSLPLLIVNWVLFTAGISALLFSWLSALG